MKITRENVSKLPKKEQDLILALLVDIEEMNRHLPLRFKNFQLEWIDEHTEYSPERVDPCPDYYGMYRLWQGDDILGIEMDIDTLDTALCLLYDYLIE